MDAMNSSPTRRPTMPGGCPQRPAVDLRPIERLLARIEATYHPVQVWLFGSRARGEDAPESDWDLLVVVPDEAEAAVLNPLLAWRICKESGVRADVIPCRTSEFRDARDTVNTLAYVVAREGVALRGG